MLKFFFFFFFFFFLNFWLIGEACMIVVFLFVINYKFVNYYVGLGFGFGLDLYSFILFLVVLLIFMTLFFYDFLFIDFVYVLVFMILLFFCFVFIMDFIYMFFFFEFSMFFMIYILLILSFSMERFFTSYYLIYYMVFFSFPSLIGFLFFDFFSYYLFYYDLGVDLFVYLFVLFSFLVKLSFFGFHSWLIKVHVDSLIMGSVILSSIFLKMGSYGLIRLLFFFDFYWFSFFFVFFGLFGSFFISFYIIFIGDVKLVIAFSSVIHMNSSISSFFGGLDFGFVGFYVMSLGHSFSSSCMFMVFGLVYDFGKSRSFYFMKGLFFINMLLGIFFFSCIWFNLCSPLSLGFLGELFVFSGLFYYWELSFFFCFFVMFFGMIYNVYVGSYFFGLGFFNYKFVKIFMSNYYLVLVFFFLLFFCFVYVMVF